MNEQQPTREELIFALNLALRRLRKTERQISEILPSDRGLLASLSSDSDQARKIAIYLTTLEGVKIGIDVAIEGIEEVSHATT